MAKKLRDSAYVNDLVIYRNACEEKKLKFTLTQLENLKSVYQRQKEQEKMFFAVQHMAVPVKTDSVIRNLRRSLEKSKTSPQPASILQDGGISRNASRVTFRDDKAQNSAHVRHNNNPSRNTDHGRANSGTSHISQRVGSGSRTETQPLRNSNPLRKTNANTRNIRVISPSHKKVNQMNSRQQFSDGTVKKRTPHFEEYVEAIPNQYTLLNEKEAVTLDNKERARSILESLESRRGSTWDSETSRRQAFAPRITDLPPLDINIYENPCSEKDSREKWQTLVNVMKNSRIEETRSELEVTRYNQEIRREWQNKYNEIKRDRITAMIKDKMRINDGEQLTLVKFLPKSRQTDFIKEAQLTQHKV